MKKILFGIFVISAIASTFYLFSNKNSKPLNPETESVVETFETTTISNLAFSYRTAPEGYSLLSDHVSWPEDIISSITLFNTREYTELQQYEFATEYPPAITVSVFKNPKRLTALDWAKANSPASNIELIEGVPMSVAVGGREGIFYVVNGLYLFDTYVFAYDEEVYLISGAYHETGDSYHNNLQNIILSAAFK